MKKELSINGETFIMIIVLDLQSEKRIGGERWHKLTVTCEQRGYRYEKFIENSKLREEIETAESEAKKFLENPEQKDPVVTLLEEMGFK